MKKCKSCKQEIDPKATKCPHCQTDQRNWFRRHPIWTVILALFILGILGSAIGSASNKGASVPAASDNANTNNMQVATQAPVTKAAPQVLLDLSGSGTKTTQKFTAGGDWDLNWTYDCSNFGSQGNFAVIIYNGDSTMSLQNAAVNQLGAKDSGVEHYHTGGTFYFVVNSECSWTVQAKG